jgi:hypothetical protein
MCGSQNSSGNAMTIPNINILGIVKAIFKIDSPLQPNQFPGVPSLRSVKNKKVLCTLRRGLSLHLL